MNNKLTERQREILSFIEGEMKADRVPTYEDIAENFEFSTTSARNHVNTLVKKKYLSLHIFRKRNRKKLINEPEVIKNQVIERLVHKPALIEVPRNIVEIPIYDTILEDDPYLCEKKVKHILAVPYDKIKFIKDDCFGFVCFTDSMNGAGIRKDDILIGQRLDKANNQDIVLANIAGQNVVRRIYYGGTYTILLSDTPGIDPQYYPNNNLVVIGKCIGIHRWLNI